MHEIYKDVYPNGTLVGIGMTAVVWPLVCCVPYVTILSPSHTSHADMSDELQNLHVSNATSVQTDVINHSQVMRPFSSENYPE